MSRWRAHRGAVLSLTGLSVLLFLPHAWGRAFLPSAAWLSGVAPWGEPRAAARGSPFSDDARAFYPAVSFTAGEWRAGRLPLWNPLVQCGAPHFGHPNAQVVNPLFLPFVLWPTPYMWGLTFLFTHVLLALFVYACFFDMCRSRWAAWAGAVGVSWSPWTLFWLMSGQPLVQTFLPFPLIVLAINRAARQGGAFWVGVGALAVAWMIAGGHAQIYVGALAAAAVYGLTAGVLAVGGRRAAWGRAVCGILGLGGVCAAVCLAPQWALAVGSFRNPAAGQATEHLRPWHVFTYWMPNVFGNVLADAHWMPSAPAGYVGQALLFSALVGLWRFRGRCSQSARACAAAILAPLVFAALVAYGTPVARILEAAVPGWRWLFRFYKMDGLVVFWLAAWGANALARAWEEGEGAAFSRRVGLSCAAAGALFAGGLMGLGVAVRAAPEAVAAYASAAARPWVEAASARHGANRYPEERERLDAHYRARVAALVPAWRDATTSLDTWWAPAVALAGGLWLWRRGRKGGSPAAWPWAAFLIADVLPAARPVWTAHAPPARYVLKGEDVAALAARVRASGGRALALEGEAGAARFAPPETLSVAGVPVPDGYGLPGPFAARLARRMNAPGAGYLPWDSPLNTRFYRAARPAVDLLGVRFVAIEAGRALPSEWAGAARVRAGARMDVYENATALPPAWIVPAARPASDAEALAALVGQVSFDPRREVLVPRRILPSARAVSGAPGCALVTARGPRFWEIACAAPAGGWLVVAQTFDTGWRATVDGTPAEVVRANGFLQAVRLPPRASARVRLVYRPAWLAPAAGASLLGVAAAMLCVGWGGVRGRRYTGDA